MCVSMEPASQPSLHHQQHFFLPCFHLSVLGFRGTCYNGGQIVIHSCSSYLYVCVSCLINRMVSSSEQSCSKCIPFFTSASALSDPFRVIINIFPRFFFISLYSLCFWTQCTCSMKVNYHGPNVAEVSSSVLFLCLNRQQTFYSFCVCTDLLNY